MRLEDDLTVGNMAAPLHQRGCRQIHRQRYGDSFGGDIADQRDFAAKIFPLKGDHPVAFAGVQPAGRAEAQNIVLPFQGVQLPDDFLPAETGRGGGVYS